MWRATNRLGWPNMYSDNWSDDKCGIMTFLRYFPEPRAMRGRDEFLPCPLSFPWLRQFQASPCLPRSVAGRPCVVCQEAFRPRSKWPPLVPVIGPELREIARDRRWYGRRYRRVCWRERHASPNAEAPYRD